MTASAPAQLSPTRLWPLALGTLGVVYGDVGTSPLYALRDSLGDLYDIPVTPDNILGVLSLIFWSTHLGDFSEAFAVMSRNARNAPMFFGFLPDWLLKSACKSSFELSRGQAV